MSEIDIEVAKRRLRVIGSHFDTDIQQALNAAEREACRYMDVAALPRQDPVPPASAGEVEPDVVDAVLLLVKASTEAVTPQEIHGYRLAAESKLFPHRRGLGV